MTCQVLCRLKCYTKEHEQTSRKLRKEAQKSKEKELVPYLSVWAELAVVDDMVCSCQYRGYQDLAGKYWT